MKSSSVRRGNEGTEGRVVMVEEARVGVWNNNVIMLDIEDGDVGLEHQQR